MKLEFWRQILEKYSNIKFHANPSGGSWQAAERTDRHDDANSTFPHFANAPKNSPLTYVNVKRTHKVNWLCLLHKTPYHSHSYTILKPICYNSVSGFNAGSSVLHTLLQPGRYRSTFFLEQVKRKLWSMCMQAHCAHSHTRANKHTFVTFTAN
jgi:hypothetical protein